MYEERPTGSRCWEPVQPCDTVYEDVRAAPRWFSYPEDGARSPTRFRSALLVDLRLSR